MKYNIRLACCLILAVSLSLTGNAQEANLMQLYGIPVTGNQDTLRFGVVLPPSYGQHSYAYPVIYYMHGMNRHYAGPRAHWIANFFYQQCKEGLLPEFIMVFIDDGEGYVCDHADGDPLLETDIVTSLIPYMDQHYSTDPAQRLTMGYSLGGNGAIFMYAKHPELFRAGISLDGGIVTYEDYVQRTGGRPEIISDEEYFYEYGSPYNWVKRNREALLEKQEPSIFLSAALLKEANEAFVSVLDAEGIPSTFIELKDFNHEFGYVFSGSEEALLAFLAGILERER